MYVFDTNIFLVLGHYYPDNFPSIWEHLNNLVLEEKLFSVKEVRREIEINSHTEHIADWVKANSKIFRIPTKEEMEVVAEIFHNPIFLGLVKRNNLLKGMPVADPFIVAFAKIHGAIVVTQEKHKRNAARIPNVCKTMEVPCLNMEKFLKKEKIKL